MPQKSATNVKFSLSPRTHTNTQVSFVVAHTFIKFYVLFDLKSTLPTTIRTVYANDDDDYNDETEIDI